MSSKTALAYKKRISNSGLSIYDEIKPGNQDFWIPSEDLQILLLESLRGVSLKGLPLRTRSKIVKELVCKALGYPVPKSFKKTQPRFTGQCLDTYVLKSNNLQIWNEEISPIRRYALIKVSEDDCITNVKVLNGESLALLDLTGTLTQKYQARVGVIKDHAELVVDKDTDNLIKVIKKASKVGKTELPTDSPSSESLLPISVLFNQLKILVGKTFSDLGSDQERNRGGYLHKLVCENLGYQSYKDNGQFPDVRHQLLEVKLQTSPTIDLGLVTPDSTELLDILPISGIKIRHCDVRYAIFCASTDGKKVKIENLILSSGQAFFSRFARFEGKVVNRKIQIPLPSKIFSD